MIIFFVHVILNKNNKKPLILTKKLYWFVNFSVLVKKKIFSPCSSGQFVNRPKKHVSGRFSIFQPQPRQPKTCWKAGQGHCERSVSIFSAIWWTYFFFIKHYALIFNIFVSVCCWATPSYFFNLTLIANIIFFSFSLMLKLLPVLILHVFTNF